MTRATSTEVSSVYNLKLVAMALAGYNDQITSKSGLWKDICLDPAILSEIRHPYLRACFTFLCNDNKSFKAVLNEPEILLTDRVAFGCRFLEDQEVTIRTLDFSNIKLLQYIENLVLELTKQGSLEGILLTGLTGSAVDIFEQYINLIGDVQSASLILSHVFPKKYKDLRVENWVKMYLIFGYV